MGWYRDLQRGGLSEPEYQEQLRNMRKLPLMRLVAVALVVAAVLWLIGEWLGA